MQSNIMHTPIKYSDVITANNIIFTYLVQAHSRTFVALPVSTILFAWSNMDKSGN